MGAECNVSGDLIPPHDMYEACRVLAKHVRWNGGLDWDWSALRKTEPTPEFERLIRSYLRDVLAYPGEHKGWKIPETTLAYPWIVRMFPDACYIFWVRNPCDCILGAHLTDNLADFGIEAPQPDDVRERRAISWYYQYRLVKSFDPPRRAITVRFEDFVLRQDETLARLEAFLGFPLAKIPVNKEAVDRHKSDNGTHYYDFLAPIMEEFGYSAPRSSK